MSIQAGGESLPLLGSGPELDTAANEIAQIARFTKELKGISDTVKREGNLNHSQHRRMKQIRQETKSLEKNVRYLLLQKRDPADEPKLKRLRSHFEDALKRYNEVLKNSVRVEREFVAKLEEQVRERNRREYERGGEMSQAQIVEEQQQKLQQQQQVQHHEFDGLQEVDNLDERLIRELNDDIGRAESELSEIVELMTEMGAEIVSQGEQLEVVGEQMYEAEDEVTMALSELEKAPCCATCWCCN
eukprot:CAMPEP_0201492144 /NCGR_PEP_ID=MMETSP0151_2-20130828/32099_1 /ASSEMBLY_ACC=CAM_ASM_000257 /TAXON_ID=200890 /ORGANISM="Paramoeba atlantica, Strain 621/1 / CCAP 1560/9" /LENGTH=244 /DNA_ID=CAMNT_0047878811 /DNA_START=100 /DNA_END=831 /DNA_ORIENTATION=+